MTHLLYGYPNLVQFLRRGARLSNYMNAPLYAVFVDASDHFLSKQESLLVETCDKLCREFDGEFLRVRNSDVPSAIAEVAAIHHISQIIIGEVNSLVGNISLRVPLRSDSCD